LGYTGAVFNKFFGTSQGMIIATLFALIWVLVPSFSLVRIAKSKDF
jgi:Cu-processing system permease protein